MKTFAVRPKRMHGCTAGILPLAKTAKIAKMPLQRLKQLGGLVPFRADGAAGQPESPNSTFSFRLIRLIGPICLIQLFTTTNRPS